MEILSFTHALWFLRYRAQQTEFFLILDHFMLFYLSPLPEQPEELKFWKNEKNLYIIILDKYTINGNHLLYGSCDINCKRERESSIFLTFYPANSLKNENIKIWKKHLKISSFYTSVPKLMIISYTVLEIWHVTDVIVVFHFE